MCYTEIPGSDLEFTSLEGTWSDYRSLTPEIVFASELRVARADESTPFFMLPFINFRGFPSFRYLSEGLVQVKGEGRWYFFGAVAFARICIVTEEGWDWNTANEAWGYGIGARYVVSEADQLNVGFDIARGQRRRDRLLLPHRRGVLTGTVCLFMADTAGDRDYRSGVMVTDIFIVVIAAASHSRSWSRSLSGASCVVKSRTRPVNSRARPASARRPGSI